MADESGGGRQRGETHTKISPKEGGGNGRREGEFCGEVGGIRRATETVFFYRRQGAFISGPPCGAKRANPRAPPEKFESVTASICRDLTGRCALGEGRGYIPGAGGFCGGIGIGQRGAWLKFINSKPTVGVENTRTFFFFFPKPGSSSGPRDCNSRWMSNAAENWLALEVPKHIRGGEERDRTQFSNPRNREMICSFSGSIGGFD